jgi:large subunit ribosomal protein L25
MAEIRLAAQPRAEQGSAASRRLRHHGRVPGVVYGHGTGPVAVSVDARELRAALASGGANALFDLEIEGEVHLALARELQQHPVRRTLSHVDFQLVARDEVVHADVPLVLVGEASAVTRAGGTLEHVVTTLAVRAKPADLPAEIEVSVGDLALGDAVRLADLVLPRGVTSDIDPDTVIVVGAPGALSAPGSGEAAGEESAAGASAAG